MTCDIYYSLDLLKQYTTHPSLRASGRYQYLNVDSNIDMDIELSILAQSK
jgi:hypothetical protein